MCSFNPDCDGTSTNYSGFNPKIDVSFSEDSDIYKELSNNF